MIRWVLLAMAFAVAPLALAEEVSPAKCVESNWSSAAHDAKTGLQREPDVLERSLALADALTAQGCYEGAVQVLEQWQLGHARNPVLDARLRSARSMTSEQHYIDNVTRAEEAARLQRNLLRCRSLADITACDEALSVRRSDWALMISKGDALVQRGRGPEALSIYRRAADLHPDDAALQAKIRTIDTHETQRAQAAEPAKASAVTEPAAPAAATRRDRVVAVAVRKKPTVYSNAAAPGHSN